METTQQETITLKSRSEVDSNLSTHKFFLVVDGVAVSYLKLMVRDEYAGMASLCTIETRPGYQRQGYAKMIIEMASDLLGMTVGTTGGFTPEGFEAFGRKIPAIGSWPVATKATFESMTFIDDWENLRRFS